MLSSLFLSRRAAAAEPETVYVNRSAGQSEVGWSDIEDIPDHSHLITNGGFRTEIFNEIVQVAAYADRLLFCIIH